MTRPAHTEPLQFRDIDEVADALREQGGRFSASRRIVLEALFAADEPMSAEQIAAGADDGATKLDATTVYRILERLEELGVIRHVHLGHGPGLYTLTHDGVREYLLCDRCDRVTAVDPSELDHIRAMVRETFGFEASFTHFPIVGLCARCAAAPTTPHEHSHGV
jgi:Fur family ferric uptake transcriptional regulator